MTTHPNIIKPINPRYASEAAFKAHELDYIKSYLSDQIAHWYDLINEYEDHNTTGHVTSITSYGPNDEHLLIRYAENHDGGHPMYDIISECNIPNYRKYFPEQLVYIWRRSL